MSGRRWQDDKNTQDVIEDSMVRIRSAIRSLARPFTTLGALAGAVAATAGARGGLTGSGTSSRRSPNRARTITELHDFIFWICVVIFVGVFGTMFYSLFKHRKSVGHQAAQFHENTTVEVVWTVIPFLILLFMA